DELLAELLPPLETDGTSHLWEALGRKFTDMTYLEADLLSKRNKEFIKSLFPSENVYASLLPREAQDVIGKVGRETRGVEKMLRRIGFQYCNRIDPFDGGPHFRATTDEILLVKRTRKPKVAEITDTPRGQKSLVAVQLKEAPFFRCTARPATMLNDEAVAIDSATAAYLGVEVGSDVAVLPLD
ncbi:MAG: arginine N-succinyltransferase, partial [Deltaproteobacteria bacterium]